MCVLLGWLYSVLLLPVVLHGYLNPTHVYFMLPQVGSGLTLADVCIACTLLPLFQSVLSEEARQAYPATTRWLTTMSQSAHFHKVLGKQSM